MGPPAGEAGAGIDPQPVPAEAAKAKEPKAAKRETKEAIRDLQVQQDQVLLRIKDNEIEHDRLQKQSQEFADKINAAAKKDADEQHVDIEKYLFDVSKMVWIPKEDGEKK
jgi:flagellum-specific peptidoglycan hydrolase FlgJ